MRVHSTECLGRVIMEYLERVSTEDLEWVEYQDEQGVKGTIERFPPYKRTRDGVDAKQVMGHRANIYVTYMRVLALL